MACTIHRLVCMALVCIIGLIGYGSAVSVTMEVQHIFVGIAEVNITCRAVHTLPASDRVLSMEIMMYDTSIISIDNQQHVTKGSGYKKYMKANGIIDDDNSSLNLTLSKPTYSDLGTYKCQVSYFDENDQINTENAAAYMSWNECDEGWSVYRQDQTCLKVFGLNNVSKAHSWSDAQAACHSIFYNAKLVEIRDEKKNKFVDDLIADSIHENVWIGVKNYAKNDGYDFKYYPDGSPVDTFHPWSKVDPTTKGKCVFKYPKTSYPGKWGVNPCTHKQAYVCSITSDRI